GRGRVRVVIEISSDERGAAHALGQGVDEQQQSDRDDALEHADRSGQGEVPAGHADVVDVQVQDLDGVAVEGILEHVVLLHAVVEDVRDGEHEQHEVGGHQLGHGDVPHGRETAGAVHLR